MLNAGGLWHVVQLMRATTDAVKIHDFIQQQLSVCKCRQKYQMQNVGDGKYKVRWLLYNE